VQTTKSHNNYTNNADDIHDTWSADEEYYNQQFTEVGLFQVLELIEQLELKQCSSFSFELKLITIFIINFYANFMSI